MLTQNKSLQIEACYGDDGMIHCTYRDEAIILGS